MKHLLTLLVLLPFAASAQPQQRQTIYSTVQNPRDFVRHIYTSINAFHSEYILSPELSKTINENIAATPRDEVPYLHFNPLCGCEGGEVLFQKMTNTSLVKPSDYMLSLKVFFSIAGYGERSVVLTLIPYGKMWRVDDVIYPDTGSLKKGLEEDTARQKKR
jgi:hypothetical protein